MKEKRLGIASQKGREKVRNSKWQIASQKGRENVVVVVVPYSLRQR